VRPADCTASETLTFVDKGQLVDADFIVVNQGTGVLFLDTGTLLTVRAVRQ
jgi:hypothetical protein